MTLIESSDRTHGQKVLNKNEGGSFGTIPNCDI